MQNKQTTKIIIDKTKLETLVRLGCSKEAIIDKIIYNKFVSQKDELIDCLLESLTDIKHFKNWGGKRYTSKKNDQLEKHLDNQVESQDEHQDEHQDDCQDESQDDCQVVDTDKDKDKDTDKDIHKIERNNNKKNKDIELPDEKTTIEALNNVFQCYDLPFVKKLTKDRFNKLKKRVKEIGGLENFREVIYYELQNSSFLRGDKEGCDFKAHIDFFLQPSSWQRVVEGFYRDKESGFKRDWYKYFEEKKGEDINE